MLQLLGGARKGPAPAATRPLAISGAFFASVIEPLVFGPDADDAAWKVCPAESGRLLDKLSAVARQTAAGRGQHNLTYGEVLPESIAAHVIPALRLASGDTFFDLGSGTGKIPLQVALAVPGVRAVGIEFAAARHDLAAAAYRRAAEVTPAQVVAAAAAAGAPLPAAPEAVCAALRDAAKRTAAAHGDFLEADLSAADAVFINNTVFEPQLMLSLTRVLAGLPRLRSLVVLRTLCKRHRERCAEKGEPCAAFAHPPVEGICNPSWCDGTTIFTYAKAAPVAAAALSKRSRGSGDSGGSGGGSGDGDGDSPSAAGSRQRRRVAAAADAPVHGAPVATLGVGGDRDAAAAAGAPALPRPASTVAVAPHAAPQMPPPTPARPPPGSRAVTPRADAARGPASTAIRALLQPSPPPPDGADADVHSADAAAPASPVRRALFAGAAAVAPPFGTPLHAATAAAAAYTTTPARPTTTALPQTGEPAATVVDSPFYTKRRLPAHPSLAL